MRTHRKPDVDPGTRAVKDAARVAGWGLASWGAIQVAANLLERRAMVLSLVQAAIAEWGAGRIGIAWSDPLAPVPSVRAIGRRAGRGALLGGAAAAVVVVTALLTRGATIAGSPPNLGLVAVGLVASALSAVRDELVLRGVVLRTTRDLLPPWASLLVCGLAAAAARLGVDAGLTTSVAAEGLRGVALGALWMRDRGAWMACAANASWTWTLGSLTHGGPADVRFAAGAAGPEGAASSLAVLGVAAVISFLSLRSRAASASLASIERRSP